MNPNPLSKTDAKLLYLLDLDARIPLTKLAKQLHTSKQVVKYHIETLQKQQIIQGFYTDINPSKLGLTIYLVYLNFQNLSPNKEKQFISHLAAQKHVGVNVSINGKWDFCLGLWAHNIFQFQTRLTQILQDYEQYIKQKTIMIETNFHYFKPKFLTNQTHTSHVTMHSSDHPIEIDHTDQTILQLLSQNSRASLVEIGQQVNLTPNAVKSRIKQLEKDHIILSYRVMINYQKLNLLHYRIFLHTQNLTQDKEKSIIQFLKQHPSVISVTKTIGYCDIECRAIVQTIHDYYQLIEELKNQFPSIIKEHESILYYKFHQVLNYFPQE